MEVGVSTAFWDEVKTHYNAKSRSGPLWHDEQTNLTKAVTLRLFQKLFIEEAHPPRR